MQLSHRTGAHSVSTWIHPRSVAYGSLHLLWVSWELVPHFKRADVFFPKVDAHTLMDKSHDPNVLCFNNRSFNKKS